MIWESDVYQHGCSLGSIIGLKWNKNEIISMYITSMQNEMLTSMAAALAASLGWNETKNEFIYITLYYIYAKGNAYQHGSFGNIIGLGWNKTNSYMLHHIYAKGNAYQHGSLGNVTGLKRNNNQFMYIILHLCKMKCLPAWQPWRRHWAEPPSRVRAPCHHGLWSWWCTSQGGIP